MSAWTPDELRRLGDAVQLRLASRRPDGSLRRFVTIWAVRAADAIYVRSAYGYDNPWFQRALRSGEGRIRAGGVERDVTFEPGGDRTLTFSRSDSQHDLGSLHLEPRQGTAVSGGMQSPLIAPSNGQSLWSASTHEATSHAAKGQSAA